MNKLIAIMGLNGAGKDTLADMITEEFGHIKTSFAHNIRVAAAGAFGLDVARFIELSTNRQTKHKPTPLLDGFSPRDVLGDVGEMFRNQYGDEHWSKTAMNLATLALGQGKPVVFSDCRWLPEARAIQDAGGIVLGIMRPRTSAPYVQTRSERQTLACWAKAVDIEVPNVGSVHDLVRTLLHLNATGALKEITKGRAVMSRATGKVFLIGTPPNDDGYARVKPDTRQTKFNAPQPKFCTLHRSEFRPLPDSRW